MGNPALEGLGFRLARAENEGIQARFVDGQHPLVATKGVDISYTFFIIIQTSDSITRVANFQTFTYILSHKPRIPINHGGANVTKGLMGENYEIRHGLPLGVLIGYFLGFRQSCSGFLGSANHSLGMSLSAQTIPYLSQNIP